MKKKEFLWEVIFIYFYYYKLILILLKLYVFFRIIYVFDYDEEVGVILNRRIVVKNDFLFGVSYFERLEIW